MPPAFFPNYENFGYNDADLTKDGIADPDTVALIATGFTDLCHAAEYCFGPERGFVFGYYSGPNLRQELRRTPASYQTLRN